MPLRSKLYSQNKSFVSLIGCPDNGYIIKIVTLASVRNSGVECDDISVTNHYDEKLAESLSRTRNKIFELAMCNCWDYFFTGTLDKNKYDRYDLDKFHKDFTRMIVKLNEKKGLHIKFLIIPEQHKDGAWHFHGLLYGLPFNELSLFRDDLYNWSRYDKKFGFSSLSKVKNKVAVNKYILKYITKDLSCSVSEVGAHMYYRSRGLQEAFKFKEGFAELGDFKPSFENDYCSVIELEYSPETIEKVLNCFI